MKKLRITIDSEWSLAFAKNSLGLLDLSKPVVMTIETPEPAKPNKRITVESIVNWAFCLH